MMLTKQKELLTHLKAAEADSHMHASYGTLYKHIIHRYMPTTGRHVTLRCGCFADDRSPKRLVKAFGF